MLKMILVMVRKKRGELRRCLHLLREHRNDYELSVAMTMDTKGHSGEVSGRNEKEETGNGRGGSPCHRVARNLGELRSIVLWKVEFENKKIGCR